MQAQCTQKAESEGNSGQEFLQDIRDGLFIFCSEEIKSYKDLQRAKSLEQVHCD